MTFFLENTRVGEFIVQRLIKESTFAASYLVVNEAGVSFFMKAFDMDNVPDRLKMDDTVAEIVNCRRISDPNIISSKETVSVEYDGVKYQCLVTPFFKGRLLSELLKSGKVFTQEEATAIIVPVMRSLVYMHRYLGLCHNDITPQNILLEEDPSGQVLPKIIDLGHTCEPINGAPPFPVEDLHVLYMAPESLKGLFSPKSDAFAVTAVLYHMLAGKAPWFCDTSKHEPFSLRKKKVRAAREAELDIPDCLNSQIVDVLSSGLKKDRGMRADVVNLLDILVGEWAPSEEYHGRQNETEPERRSSVKVQKNDSDKGGFADVAGMEGLKDSLKKRVIWVIRDKERARKYRLLPPNGMLLYGPPGCGKTFFAQKFAEESGFNYMLVNGSDLGSTYVHGTQGKIAELFKEAEKNAPTVICFDEFDSFVPTRGSTSANYRADEVNEFLSQLNNCSSRGIFVIGTTNRIDMIDPAVLRKGRLDLHVEIPAPDHETRRKMFEIHLKDRPQEDCIDVNRLAEMTEGYAAADIAYIVNEAAMVAALADDPITIEHLQASIKGNPSSLQREVRRRIGY